MLLTIDIGTSVFKSALWDFEGNRLAYAAVPVKSFPAEGLRHEADCGQWLRAFGDCCAVLAHAARAGNGAIRLADVNAVVISGNGPSLTPVLGEPELTAAGLHVDAAPARLWLDRRAEAAAAEVSSLRGAFVDQSFFVPKALAVKSNEPELYERVRVFLGCPELLAYALTGEARTVFPAEGFERWFWDAQLLETLKLDAEKFPPFIRPMEIFGGILPSLAKHFGFAPNIPVISGGSDFIAAILGTGISSPGQACDRAGSSEGINACTERRIDDARLLSYRHPVTPYWNLSGIISCSGRAVEWARDLLGLKTYDEFFALAEAAPDGEELPVFLPYLAGERAPVWNPQALAVMRNLSLSTGRPEFARSVLEGICFAIRDLIAVMEEAGAKITELRVAGAAAHNGILNRIKADVSGREILVPAQKETELLGLAIAGALALGKYASLCEAASALVRIESRVQPDEKKAEPYARLFEEYRGMKQLQNCPPGQK